MYRLLTRFAVFALLLVNTRAITAGSESVIPPAGERFAANGTAEVPDFQRHVVPLLGRLGCNGRNCHGSFQGRGGFRLSLFGYDFEMDHGGLTGEATATGGNRIDLRNPAQSLVLKKPTLIVDHEGGKRFASDSWEYRLLHRWLQSGARGTLQPQQLERLEIEPAEILLSQETESVQLRIIAVWQNGDREDVTPLCRFRTNDDSIATVSLNGEVASVAAGDTHIVAFYDNGICSVPVIRPYEAKGFLSAEVAKAASPIDRFVHAKLNKLRLVPSRLCSDTEFLRRVSIDLTGTLPTPAEVKGFIEDQDHGKRDRKINELLDRPAYAAWWTNKLCDFTGCNPRHQAELGQEVSVQWYAWIFARLEKNLPYDQLIRQIVLAQGRRPGQTFRDYAQETSSYFRDDSGIAFAERETMPHYWTRTSMDEPDRAAEAFAHNFLGIRLQCAQCHKHPFAQWTQDDYRDFSRFFENVKYGVRPESLESYRQLAKQVGMSVRGDDGAPVRNDALGQLASGKVYPWRELFIDDRGRQESVSLLRSGSVTLDGDSDPREAIMQWMNRPDNPWFAKAFVNRVWASYFGQGIVDPPDDLNPANPPSHPQLLTWLTENFILHNYDMKWLHKEIVSSQTYQRSWQPSVNNHYDRNNFSRAIPRRMPAEIVYDSVKQVVAASDKTDDVRRDLTRRASGHLSMRLAGTYAMQVFGKPERAVNCDCERDNQPTLLQSVFLQNDPIIEQRLEDSGWLQQIAERDSGIDDARIHSLIDEAWLRTLSRFPSEREVQRSFQQLREADSVAEGMRDLLWALVNIKEFLLIK